MPLSEEELRLLEQMERALVEEDPKFASTLRGTSFRRAARRRAIISGVVFVVGVAILMSGAIFAFIPLGIAGFVVMLASATYLLVNLRGGNAPAATEKATGHHGFSVIDGGRSHKPRKVRSSAPFMERMEERWRRRRDENGGF
ncbi:hypothetical protein BJ980_000908 [Nocardioides daedukensis]|uniref:DUF3040 domain-containing protein n=1 Tax=Nocardioides daedukensis TaxID=634462 RepID=A0A7Y9RXC2_9ACTN|nr:hypothetical protein [Nocardioides daedukensis]